ncbi:hypothetical protein, partial [Rhodococcus sp. T7]|uniref:hypothetical protein n=1 Tax=Rhodococcus sp. T7 TaxID=627444 RepID=UPI001F26ABCC
QRRKVHSVSSGGRNRRCWAPAATNRPRVGLEQRQRRVDHPTPTPNTTNGWAAQEGEVDVAQARTV